MPPLRFETYQPNASRYAPRISQQEWDMHKDFLTQLHADHVPRNRMLDELHSIGFYPTYGQLVTKMEEWGLMVYRKRGKRTNASEETTPRTSETVSSATPQSQFTAGSTPRSQFTASSTPIPEELPQEQPEEPSQEDDEFIPYAVIESLVMSPGKSISSVPSLNHYSSPGESNSTSWPTPRQEGYFPSTDSFSTASPYSAPTPATTVRDAPSSGLNPQSFRANLTNPFDPMNTEQFIQQYCDIQDINARNPKCQDFLFAGGHFSTAYDLYLSTFDEDSANNSFYSTSWSSDDNQPSAGSLRHVWAIINCVLSASTREEVKNLDFILQKTRMYYAKLVSRSKVKNDLARIIYRGLQDVHKRCQGQNPLALDDYEGRSQYHSLQQLLLLCRCLESLPSKRSTTVPFEISNDKMFDDYLPRILAWCQKVIAEDRYEHLKDLLGHDVTQSGRIPHMEKLVASCLIARWAEQPRPLDSSWQLENVAGREVEMTKLRRRKHLQTAALGWRPLDVFMTIASAVVRETCYTVHDLSEDQRAQIPYHSVSELFSRSVVFEYDTNSTDDHEYGGSPERTSWREIHRKIKEAYGSCNHKTSPRNEAITETCDCSSPVNLISLESHVTEFDAAQQPLKSENPASPVPSMIQNPDTQPSDLLLAADHPDRFSLRSVSNASSNYRSFRRMASRVNQIHRNGLGGASMRSAKSASGDTYRSSGTFSSNRMSIASRDSWMLQTFLQIEEDIVEDMSMDMDMMDLK